MAKVFQVNTASGGTLTTSLVSYWKMEDATDFFGSNGLTNNNSITFGAGKVNNCATLNGTSQYFSVSSTSGLPTGNHDISCNGWVNFSSNAPSGVTCFLSYGTESNQQMFGLGLGPPGSGSTNGLYFAGFANDAEVGWSYSLSTWYMITCTYTASSHNVQFYVNGSAQGTAQTLGAAANFGSTFIDIGIQRPGLLAYLPAEVDEIGLWGKVLSSNELTDLYNGGNGQTMITSVANSGFIPFF